MKTLRVRKVISLVMTAAGLFLFCMLLTSIINGEPPLLVVWLGKPKVCIVLGAFCLLSGFLSWHSESWTLKEYKTVFGKMILLAFSLITALLVGEISVRIYFERAQGFNSLEKLRKEHPSERIHLSSQTPLAHIVGLSSNKKLVYELMPKLNTDFGHRKVITNSDGMREEQEYSEVPPDDTMRIVGVGDSGMFGWNIEQGKCYLDVLEKNLSDKSNSIPVEVLNLAVPGYNTAQEIEMLEYHGLKYKPDIVIVGWCNNDFDPPFFLFQKKNFMKAKSSILYTFLFYRKQGHFEPEVLKAAEIDNQLVDQSLLKESGIEGVTREMKRLSELASKHNFKPLIFGAMNAQIVKICDDLKLDYYNTFAEIPADKYPKEFAVHYMHPKPQGHAVLAAHLEEHLRKKGWIK